MLMKLLLLRHGETFENQEGIVQGWHDNHLSQHGHAQAKQAAAAFTEQVGAIFCSDLARCRDTAQYFQEVLKNVPFFIDWRLRELDFGSATGSHKHDHDWEVLWASTPHGKSMIEGAEPLQLFQARVEQFIASLEQLHTAFASVLIVTHGGTINRFLQAIDAEHNYTAIKNCSITERTI